MIYWHFSSRNLKKKKKKIVLYIKSRKEKEGDADCFYGNFTALEQGYSREEILNFKDRENNLPLHSAVNGGNIKVKLFFLSVLVIWS